MEGSKQADDTCVIGFGSSSSEYPTASFVAIFVSCFSKTALTADVGHEAHPHPDLWLLYSQTSREGSNKKFCAIVASFLCLQA
jgi:hypothetical protein